MKDQNFSNSFAKNLVRHPRAICLLNIVRCITCRVQREWPCTTPKTSSLATQRDITRRPNGLPDSIGSIEVDTITNGPMWIEGYGLRVMGMGIQWRVLK